MSKTADVYRLFFNPGDVVEIRAYGLSGKGPWEGFAKGAGIVYGYFDNAEDFSKCADSLEKAKAPGIYFTLNPVVPALISRAVNRLKAADIKTSTTADKDIKCIRWLPIDLDPQRPAGIPSTEDELKAAIGLGREIYKYMVDECSFPPPVPAVSGNGFHLSFRLKDLPPDNSSIIKKWLTHLKEKFDNSAVDIDQAVYNPARIWKLYGTTARKGDHTEDRPHRQSYIEPGFLN